MRAPFPPPWLVMSYFPAVGIAAFAYFDFHPNWFFTSGGSAPQALWRVVDSDIDKPYQRGDWVIVCPPLSETEHRQLFVADPPREGTCASQRSLKRIAAVPGDRIVVHHPALHTPHATVEAFSNDSHGRALPRPSDGEYIVEENTYWILSRHPRSVDSRYYGAVPISNIETSVKPLWTLP